MRSRRRCRGARLNEAEIVRLFAARDADYEHVITAADALRQAVSGDVVRYVVNRNINYTNICYYRCQFCAFSKGKTHEALRGAPYDLALDEVVRRRRRRGIAAPPKSACKAASIRTTPARPISASAARSRRRCRTCTSTPSRRWR